LENKKEKLIMSPLKKRSDKVYPNYTLAKKQVLKYNRGADRNNDGQRYSMFRKNSKHLQIPLTSHVDELPEKLRKGITGSWSGVFYRDFFCRIDETPFEVLYADCPSRPNIPVNVLVGLEFLKAGNGWTDEQLYEQFGYNVQVRYALGYRQLGEGHFELRTLYNFRERLSRYMQETGHWWLRRHTTRSSWRRMASRSTSFTGSGDSGLSEYRFRPWIEYREYPPDEMSRRAQWFNDEMQRRRTIRDFSDRPVPRQIIEDCLEAAGSAPSGANMQP